MFACPSDISPRSVPGISRQRRTVAGTKFLLEGVAEAAIEEHEEAAEVTLWTGIVLGAVPLLALLVPATRGRLARHTRRAALGLAVLTFLTAGWTANLGGRIRHPEIVESLSSGDTTVVTEMENDDRQSGERKPDDGHR